MPSRKKTTWKKNTVKSTNYNKSSRRRTTRPNMLNKQLQAVKQQRKENNLYAQYTFMTPKQQCYHNLLNNTILINKKLTPELYDEVKQELAESE